MGNGSPESPGHDDTPAVVKLSAARKKDADSGFLAKSVDHSWLGGCAREKQNWNSLYRDGNDAREMMRARRSDDNDGGGENRGRRKTTTTAFWYL